MFKFLPVLVRGTKPAGKKKMLKCNTKNYNTFPVLFI